MAIIKHRKIEFGHYNDFSKAEQYKNVLLAQKGITDVRIDEGKGVLELSYNLEFITMERVETLLRDAGMVMPKSILAKTKRNWIHFTEENELENAHVPGAPCCSHPDEILAKARQKT